MQCSMIVLVQLFCVALIASTTDAQTTFTLSGCHVHDGTEYCYLPNGPEVPFTRSATLTSSGTTQATAPARTSAGTIATAEVPASVTDCHDHGSAQYCLASGTEWEVLSTPAITPLPTAYTGCHGHASAVYCLASDGSEVLIALEGFNNTTTTADHEEHTDEQHAGEASSSEDSSSSQNCHFHAGVEHCTEDVESVDSTASCGFVERDYNMGLRVGLIFVILVSSLLAVFSPILLERLTRTSLNGIVFTVLKQFGTGVIISTAFVHLLTHAEMMFANECLGELAYEATASSIAMAGAFLSFIVEYLGIRLVMKRQARGTATGDLERPGLMGSESSDSGPKSSSSTNPAVLGHNHGSSLGPDTHFSVAVMEAGIVFHSILIGITLNVTPDSYYTTLFVVILFHQTFEGLALGTRIAGLPHSTCSVIKFLMAGVFTLITPVGMAIGVGVLSHFNGNDPSTILAIGTLDALSAGILLWVGLVEMLAHDWMHGDMLSAGWLKAGVGIASLVVGLAVMSLLGKWA